MSRPIGKKHWEERRVPFRRIYSGLQRHSVTLALLLPLLAGIAFAQPPYPSCGRQPQGTFTVGDTTRYIASYLYSTYRDPAHPEDRDNDEVWMEIGDSITRQYSHPRWVNDSIAHVQLANGAEAYRPLHQWCMREEIICNRSSDTACWSYQDVLYDKAYVWYEPWPKQSWRLEDSAKEIIGYTCRKATTDFRGRHYTAWYAPEIQLPYGPWSFHGLPGLILEIKDDTNRVSFVANWLCHSPEGKPLKLYDGYYVKISRKKVRKLIDFMHKHPYIHAGKWIKGMSWLRENPKLEWKHTWVELE